MKTERKTNVNSLSVVKAVLDFKNEYFDDSTNYALSSSQQSKKDKTDKGNYSISYSDSPCCNVPSFLENRDYTDEVKKFFEDKLKRGIAFIDICWSLDKNVFDMSISIRF